jgi:DNA-directed RNA polymerase specialized sigma24 family protein
MNLKQKKAYVRSYPYITQDIERLKTEYEELYTKAVRISPQINDNPIQMPKGNTPESRFENVMIKLVEIQSRVAALEKKKNRIERELNRLKPNQRILIEEIDLKRVSIRGFAQKNGISFDTVRRKRDRIYSRILE